MATDLPSLLDIAIVPGRRPSAPCLAVGPGGVWVVASAWVDAPGPRTRRRLRARADAVRATLRGTRWAAVPVRPLVSVDEDADEHLLRDGTLAAGPTATLAAVRRGTALDALDVRGIAALLSR